MIRFNDVTFQRITRGAASILSPHVAWQNIQLGAVLGHGAPRDRNTALTQDLNDLIVAQRFIAILALHQVEDSFLHAGVAQRFAGRGLVAGRKKIFHLEYALRRGHVFA